MYCPYGQATCCGHIFPATVLQCTPQGHIVATSLHEAEDCAFAAGFCVDAGGYDAAAADAQTPTCATSNPMYTPCSSAGQACRPPGSSAGVCICQAATSPDGSAAPFWYCH